MTVVLDADALRAWPISEPADADKFSRGTVLIIGGSPSTPGAVILAGIAALRMGAGRLRIVTAADIAGHVGAVVPEAMVIGVPSTAHGLTTSADLEDAFEGVGAVVFGPGMTGDRAPTSLLADVVELVGGACPLVVDAAGLDAFVGLDQTTRTALREQVVMTPNRQEVCRLAGIEDVGNDDLMALAARRTGAVLTSFGLVLTPDGRSWQTSARPIGLGTSGAGDVLAGLVGGGVARCGDLVQGTCWATFAHMEAGVRLDATVGVGYLARELLGQVPALLATI